MDSLVGAEMRRPSVWRAQAGCIRDFECLDEREAAKSLERRGSVAVVAKAPRVAAIPGVAVHAGLRCVRIPALITTRHCAGSSP